MGKNLLNPGLWNFGDAVKVSLVVGTAGHHNRGLKTSLGKFEARRREKEAKLIG